MVEDRLTQFLVDTAKRDFRLGAWDCGLWLADWYMLKTGKPDPAAHLRGAVYGPEMLLYHMLDVVDGRLALPQTTNPQREDIGVIDAAGVIYGSLCTGRRWMLLSKRGIVGVRMEKVKLLHAWQVV